MFTKSRIANLRTLILLSLALSIAFLANFAYSQTWSDPSQAPTGGNAYPPLNTSNANQIKGGDPAIYGAGDAMITAGILRAAAPTAAVRAAEYCDYDGNNCFTPAGGAPAGGSSDIIGLYSGNQSASGVVSLSDNAFNYDMLRITCKPSSVAIAAAWGHRDEFASGISLCDNDTLTILSSGTEAEYIRTQTDNSLLKIEGFNFASGGGGASLPVCTSGEILEYDGSNWVCAPSGGGGSPVAIDHEIVTCEADGDRNGNNCTATCSAGYVVVGGGCNANYNEGSKNNDVIRSEPIGNNAWYCENHEDHGSTDYYNGVQGHAVCVTPAGAPSGGGGASLPNQSGEAGEFLMTDGSTASWEPANIAVSTCSGFDSTDLITPDYTSGYTSYTGPSDVSDYDFIEFGGFDAPAWGDRLHGSDSTMTSVLPGARGAVNLGSQSEDSHIAIEISPTEEISFSFGNGGGASARLAFVRGITIGTTCP